MSDIMDPIDIWEDDPKWGCWEDGRLWVPLSDTPTTTD